MLADFIKKLRRMRLNGKLDMNAKRQKMVIEDIEDLRDELNSLHSEEALLFHELGTL